jgi:hypothetical protein
VDFRNRTTVLLTYFRSVKFSFIYPLLSSLSPPRGRITWCVNRLYIVLNIVNLTIVVLQDDSVSVVG